MKYISKMRQRLGLEPNDNSRDEEIANMSPFQRVRLIAGWEAGDEDWADTYRHWFESQGLKVSDAAKDASFINEILSDLDENGHQVGGKAEAMLRDWLTELLT